MAENVREVSIAHVLALVAGDDDAIDVIFLLVIQLSERRRRERRRRSRRRSVRPL